MATGGMALVPVGSENHIQMLREYIKLLQSTMGPHGSCKVILTGGGYLEVASTSAALMSRLELASPICKYINNMAAGLADHGLYCGILLSRLLEQQWQECSYSKNKDIQIITPLVEELKRFLSSENVCMKIDFNSIQNFLPLVRTVITSKCPVFLSGIDVDRFCIEIIKVFINCVDEETNLINRIYTKLESGCNMFASYKGLLYTVTDSHSVKLLRGLTGCVKILVFVIKLEDSDVRTFGEMKQILELAVQSGVRVVACQKTVASEIKLFLRRKKTILLERMGNDFTKMLIDISQAFPVSQIKFDESEMANLTGHLTSIEHVQFSECDYLLLHNNNMPVGTLLVQTNSLLGEDFVKALVVQALAALRTVAVHPLLILGGGCLETCLIGEISRLEESKKEKKIRLASNWVKQALQSTCFAVEIDTVFHHAWRQGGTYCQCRMIEKQEVVQCSGSWLMLQEVVSSQVSLHAPKRPSMMLRPDVLVESHQQKLQVICAAFEAFANLSTIGLILHEI